MDFLGEMFGSQGHTQENNNFSNFMRDLVGASNNQLDGKVVKKNFSLKNSYEENLIDEIDSDYYYTHQGENSSSITNNYDYLNEISEMDKLIDEQNNKIAMKKSNAENILKNTANKNNKKNNNNHQPSGFNVSVPNIAKKSSNQIYNNQNNNFKDNTILETLEEEDSFFPAPDNKKSVNINNLTIIKNNNEKSHNPLYNNTNFKMYNPAEIDNFKEHSFMNNNKRAKHEEMIVKPSENEKEQSHNNYNDRQNVTKKDILKNYLTNHSTKNTQIPSNTNNLTNHLEEKSQIEKNQFTGGNKKISITDKKEKEVVLEQIKAQYNLLTQCYNEKKEKIKFISNMTRLYDKLYSVQEEFKSKLPFFIQKYLENYLKKLEDYKLLISLADNSISEKLDKFEELTDKIEHKFKF